jgi:hypothetical protein
MKYENQFLNVVGSPVLANVNRGAMTTQDFSMPNIPQQSVVVRGSALAGSNINRSNIASQSSFGEVAQDKAQSSVILNKIAQIDSQINQLNQLLSDTQNTQVTQKGIYDELKDKIEKSDRANPVSPFKMSASQRAIAVQNMQTAFNSYQTASASIKTYSDQINALLAERKVYENQLVALGRPIPRRPNMVIQGRENATLAGTANKIADEIKNTFSGGFGGGFGGGGFGGGADMGEEGTDSANQSFFGKNKLAILALGGVVGYLLLKR